MAQAPSPTASAAAAGPARVVYSVTRLNREVRLLLEQRLAVVWVEGELTNLSQPGSGHWYFGLKDRDAQVRCAMFRMRNVNVGFTPRVGQQVLARARVGLYEPRGEYQLVIEHLEEAGVGALQRQLERLKERLAAEGLFAAEIKRTLPRFPRRIGIVTSPTGAAVRDVLHIVGRRYPPAAILVYPTPVQGAAAVPAIVAALQRASERRDCDVLLLVRGGGSLEDLWAFNDERVVRAVRACAVPIVAGVGHEIDFTLADLAADARAPTPSGAAELATPDRDSLLSALAKTESRLLVAAGRELRAIEARLAHASTRLRLGHPGVRLANQAQRLSELQQRAVHALERALQRRLGTLAALSTRLERRSPAHRVRELALRYSGAAARLEQAIDALLARRQNRLGLAARALDAVSPLATLDRGFAIVTRASDGAPVSDAASIAEQEEIIARLARGRLRARVVSRELGAGPGTPQAPAAAQPREMPRPPNTGEPE
jgi:exodeoxyribonuclease VII large subunit